MKTKHALLLAAFLLPTTFVFSQNSECLIPVTLRSGIHIVLGMSDIRYVLPTDQMAVIVRSGDRFEVFESVDSIVILASGELVTFTDAKDGRTKAIAKNFINQIREGQASKAVIVTWSTQLTFDCTDTYDDIMERFTVCYANGSSDGSGNSGGGDDDWRWYNEGDTTYSDALYRMGRTNIFVTTAADTTHGFRVDSTFQFRTDGGRDIFDWQVGGGTGTDYTPHAGLFYRGRNTFESSLVGSGHNNITLGADDNTISDRDRLGAIIFAGKNPTGSGGYRPGAMITAFADVPAGGWSGDSSATSLNFYVTRPNQNTLTNIFTMQRDGRFEMDRYQFFEDGVPERMLGFDDGSDDVTVHSIDGTPGNNSILGLNATGSGLEWKDQSDVANAGIRYTVYQPAHGFTLPAHGFIPVYRDSVTGWELALANDSTKLHSAYVVEVINSDSIVLMEAGILTVTGGHGLGFGDYFLTNAGSIANAPGFHNDWVATVWDTISLALKATRPVLGAVPDTTTYLTDGTIFGGDVSGTYNSLSINSTLLNNLAKSSSTNGLFTANIIPISDGSGQLSSGGPYGTATQIAVIGTALRYSTLGTGDLLQLHGGAAGATEYLNYNTTNGLSVLGTSFLKTDALWLRSNSAPCYVGNNGDSGTSSMVIYAGKNGANTSFANILFGNGTSSSLTHERMRIVGQTGSLLIGTTTDNAKLNVLGTGTGTGKTFLLESSTGTDNFAVLDNGNIELNAGSFIRQAGGSGGLRINGNDWVFYNQGNNEIARLTTTNTGTNGGLSVSGLFGVATTSLSNTRTLNATSSATSSIYQALVVAPTSGTGAFYNFDIANTINQTGGANGIVRDIYIRPTLTAAADYRALEINIASGKGIWQIGTSAVNKIEGNLGIGVEPLSTAQLAISASTSSEAAINIAAGSAPTTPVSGDIWSDSSQKALIANQAGINQTLVGTIFTGTANATTNNTNTDISITPPGVGTLTLPANFFVAGKKLRVALNGNYTTDAVTTPTLQLKLKAGSTTIATFSANTIPTKTSNGIFTAEFVVTCRTTGVSGTVMGFGEMELNDTELTRDASWKTPATSTFTLDTTTSQALTVTAAFGTADTDNSITVTQISVEILN